MKYKYCEKGVKFNDTMASACRPTTFEELAGIIEVIDMVLLHLIGRNFDLDQSDIQELV